MFQLRMILAKTCSIIDNNLKNQSDVLLQASVETDRSVDIFIQARVGSTRLPGKVLRELCGLPVLFHVCSRVRKFRFLGNLVVLTSDSGEDDKIEEFCTKFKFACFRGSLQDVLDRYYQAACHFHSRHIVRLTADCPCIDVSILNQVAELYFEKNFDYVYNAIVPTFPDGLDCEIFSFATLEKAWKESTRRYQREHLTQYLYDHPELFKMGSFTSKIDYSHLRLTLDTAEDYQLISAIFDRLYKSTEDFAFPDILKLVESEPELFSINRDHVRDGAMRKQIQDELSGDKK